MISLGTLKEITDLRSVWPHEALNFTPWVSENVEWLNNHTDDKIGFFLCEIKLFQIGDSQIAPSFTVVERPNDWTKEIKKTTATNPTQQQRLEYWQAFNDYAFQNAEFNKAFNKRKPTTDHWMDFSIGSSACHIAVSQIQKRNAIDVELYINDDKELFRNLFLHKDEIELVMGVTLDWRELPERKASRIIIEKEVTFDDRAAWSQQFDYIMDVCMKMKKAFKEDMLFFYMTIMNILKQNWMIHS